MDCRYDDRGTERRLALAGELTVYAVDGLWAEWAPRLDDAPARWRLDLSALDDFDTAGLQLLLVLQRALAARGKTCRLGAAPPAVRDLLALYRAGGWFEWEAGAAP